MRVPSIHRRLLRRAGVFDARRLRARPTVTVADPPSRQEPSDRWSGAKPPYLGRSAALATKHGKEAILAPLLETTGLTIVLTDVDTDRFGTFTGEIERRGTPLEVAERKARAAMAAAGTDLGLASEGSFGPLPDLPFVNADREIVLLVDDQLGVVIVEEAVSFATAAASLAVRPGDDIRSFCLGVGFPLQALICRPGDGSRKHITKAITDGGTLQRALAEAAAASRDGCALIETDLRAHLCPTRQMVIGEAAQRLAARLSSRCRECGVPGFGARTDEPGLRCRRCGLPTAAVAATVTQCLSCGYAACEVSGTEADPSHCAWCNP